MNVGIMSMQRIINYGSFLQAYGLKKVIESLGHNVQFVDYEVNPPLELLDKVNNKNNKVLSALKIIFSNNYRNKRKDDIKQNLAFQTYYNTFKNEWLKWLELTDDNNFLPKLDTLVIGSDEVFNCCQKNTDVGYSIQLFGANNNAKKLITYAATFGSTTKEKLIKYDKYKEISSLINNFDSLSVRDKNTHQMVSEMTGKEPIDNVDPVLVYDFSNEVKDNIDLKDYLVVYAYSGRIKEDEAEKIQQFAHSKGLKTLSIGVMQSFTDMYINVDPFTMLSYIKNANYVVTDTFHGTVFSIKYQVPFVSIIRESNSQKLTDLLDKFELRSRTLKDITTLDEVMLQKLDTEKIKCLLQTKREDAISYLKTNI